MVSWLTMAAATIVALGASWAATGAVLRFLESRAILDEPNPRSSHQRPTPRGGGIAVMGVVLPAWAAIALLGADGGPVWVVLAGAVPLAALSWADDLRGLPAAARLAAHALAVALGLAALSGMGPVFQGILPGWLDTLAAALLWLWFLNLFNFMDGIDGIAGVEAATVGGGLALVAALAGGGSGAAPYALTLAAAALGFLAWNWHPARLFLGDVGSVPLGYLLGWLLLIAAAGGQWAPALILPLYYLADASITLGRRLARGERIWLAHREHFYQRAVRGGRGHGQVALTILAANLALVALAGAAALWPPPWAALAGAVLTVGFLLYCLSRPARPG